MKHGNQNEVVYPVDLTFDELVRIYLLSYDNEVGPPENRFYRQIGELFSSVEIEALNQIEKEKRRAMTLQTWRKTVAEENA